MSPLRTRSDLLQFADHLLLAVEDFRSPDGAHIVLPGPPGGYGRAVDGLEGFARTFLLLGMRVAGEGGTDQHGQLARYAQGLVTGTDSTARQRWVRPSEHGQAKVEAASLALVLDWTRPWLWQRLGPTEQERIVDYLAEVVGDDDYPRTNWLWFQIVVETFLRSVGGPHSLNDITAALERLDSFYAGHGWYRDGESRAFDHYSGWAMQLYPTLWARMRGAEDLAAARIGSDRDRLDRYLQDLLLLTGADGAPLIQGRSLTYRFAAAAPWWAGALAEVPSISPGRLRTGALAIIDYFRARGVPNERGLLDTGWWGRWPPIAQSYSGTGSAYWAAKGFLGLLLDESHPVWTAPSSEAAATQANTQREIHPPGWILSATADDGIARVANHGTDHAAPGDHGGDSPWYARLSYSTATSPLADDASWHGPVDQSVVLVDAAGRRSHRTGMTTLGLPQPAAAVVAGSRANAHWLAGDASLGGHGSGAAGSAEPAGQITVVSVLRAHWEVRLVHLAHPVPAVRGIEAGGWAIAADGGVREHAGSARMDLESTTHTSSLVASPEFTEIYVTHRDDASPIGRDAAVAVARGPAAVGWSWVAIALGGVGLCREAPEVTIGQDHALVQWPDGERLRIKIADLMGDHTGGEH